MYIFRLIKSWFCDHQYENAKPCPFITADNCHCAVYVCEKCGKQKLIEFRK